MTDKNSENLINLLLENGFAPTSSVAVFGML